MKYLALKQHTTKWTLTLTLLTMAGTASAHTETGVAGGLISGFLHPLFGLDHLIAMVAVGLWGAQLERPAIWLLPITFPAVMAVGGLLGVAGVALPGIEIGIALSALALGTMVATNARPPLWIAAVLVGFFAVFHGHAHGAELPTAANPLAYGVGFITCTGLLHLSGILLGTLTRWPAGRQAIRGLGGLIAALGAYFSAAAFGLIA
ncbi:MAG: Ni/Fe hydrogenase [Pseudomonadales bacterium]|nr:Ni/Fe hydrogenase [Pseudomonadales bacterium]RLU03875.1 MAG: Ni/Fe hydrogenase [Ketobacter sp.]